MVERDQAVMTARIQIILHRALVQIRNLAAAGSLEQTRDLADAVEFLPDLVLRWDVERANHVRPALAQFEAKYPDSAPRYTSILDADEAEFHRLYGARRFDWDAPRDVHTAAG